MSRERQKTVTKPTSSQASRILMRQTCACGGAVGPTGECARCRRKRVGMQPKLRVNQPNDRYEREADHFSQQLLSNPIIDQASSPRSATADAHQSFSFSGDTRLPESFQKRIARHMGNQGLSQIRLHNDTQAHQINQQLEARAVTYGQNIFFGKGQFDPHSTRGQALIAHELAHTIQQQSQPMLQRKELSEEEKKALDTQVRADRDALIKSLKEKPLDVTENKKLARLQGKLDILKMKVNGIQPRSLSKNNKVVLKAVKTFVDLVKNHLRTASLWRRAIVRFTNLEAVTDDYIDRIDELKTKKYSQKYVKTFLNNNRRLGLSVEQFYFEVFYEKQAIEMGVTLSDEAVAGAGGAAAKADEASGQTPADQPSGPTKSPLTEEQIELLNKFIQALAKKPKSEEESSDQEPLDRYEIIRLLQSMPDVDRADVLRILPDLINKDPEETSEADLLDALQKLAALSEAERQMLVTNKILHPEAPAKTEIPDEINFALKPDHEKVFQDTGKKDENIDRLQQEIDQARATIRKKHGAEEESVLDKLFGRSGASSIPFFNELLLFEGLLIGASEKHPEIKTIAQEITHDMAQLRTLIQREIALLAAEMGATAVFSLLTSAVSGGASLLVAGARFAHLAVKVNRLKNLLEKVEAVYQIINRVQEVVATVQQAGETYDRFAGQFDLLLQRWEKLQALYDSVDAPDDVEEQLERLETELFTQMEAKLGTNMGDILSQFYIPDDVSEEELIDILLNIPKGINAFREVLTYYQGGGDDPNFRATLLGKAIVAGALLYPVVGYLAFLTQDKLAEVVAEMNKSFGEKFQEWLSGGAPRLGGRKRGRRKTTSKQKNKERLSPSARKKETEDAYQNDKSFKRALDKEKDSGKKFMIDYFNTHGMKEDRGDKKTIWTDSWFKIVARDGVKELNRRKKKVKIKGKPLPRFKLRKFDHEADGPDVTLKLNPEVEIEPGSSLWLKLDDLRVYKGENSSQKGIAVPADNEMRTAQEKVLQKEFKIPKDWPIESETAIHTTPKAHKRTGPSVNGYIYIHNNHYYWADLLDLGTQNNPIQIFWHKRSLTHMETNAKIKLLPAPKKEEDITAGDFREYSIKDISIIQIPDPKSTEAIDLKNKQRELKSKKDRLDTLRPEKEALEAEKKARTFQTTNQKLAADLVAANAELTNAEADLKKLHDARDKDTTPGKRSPTHYGKISLATDRVKAAKREVKRIESIQSRRQEVNSANLSALEQEIAQDEKEVKRLKEKQDQNPVTKPEKIGLKPDYYPNIGKKIKRSPGRGDSEKQKFRDVMNAAGMEHDKNPDKAKAGLYQIEHIIDNAYDGGLSGGADTRHNLWPITATDNPPPWQIVNAKTLRETGEKGKPNYKVGGSTARFHGKWFEIANYVPNNVALKDDMVYGSESWFINAMKHRRPAP